MMFGISFGLVLKSSIVHKEGVEFMEVKLVTTEKELQEAFKIRVEVFVKEQGVPLENELDEHEAAADHVIAYYNDKPVGTGRLRIIDAVAKLERICILSAARKFGLGRIIVDMLENIAKEKGASKAVLHGQTHAEKFYTRLGYQRKSEMFMEESIPHFLMEKSL